ncbi:uncharacterized protein N0V89_005477 [Didymosphaeria variabile]|uniref:Protein kinase domain-containing protein n=1 Tax=Didymosphaeria variabile TaxID=1932322 RepID=A0A9W8XNL0_9PLEO|nr:uncharacterized protein N0V89_005477 [Didymosphaeria variabile]KAJ4353747.1 hypothetical protein N0V89_005477 [Didymosphaeria variabile]
MSLNLPTGCPRIPDSVSRNDLVAVVVVKHDDAYDVNHNSAYERRELFEKNSITGRNQSCAAQIYLHRLASQPKYSFGKGYLPEQEPEPQLESDCKSKSKSETDLDSSLESESGEEVDQARPIPIYDVYLPIRSAVKQLFELMPDGPAGCWRIEATSMAVVTVAGVEIQKPQPRTTTKKKKSKSLRSLPHALYLDASVMSVITFGNITINLWLIQSPVEVLRSDRDFKANNLQKESQNDWAKDAYIWDLRKKQVSFNSWRVTQRFTETVATAKIYKHANGIGDRDREMLMFSKQNTHHSIVHYQLAAELHGVPVAITDTHESMISFAAMQRDLPSMHPGARFKLAAAIFRPLFSALEWLHYNRIVHGSVTPASVLLQVVGGRLSKLLLVDYSYAYLVDMGENMPQELMRHESTQAMDIIETCSNIWTLRQKPLPEWKPEPIMAQLASQAEHHFAMVKQACDDFYYRKPESWQNKARAKMLEMLALKERKWEQAREAQVRNSRLLQVSALTRADLQKIMLEWKRFKANRSYNMGETTAGQPDNEDYAMILTLGHAYLDELANSICSAKVYPQLPLPHEICSRLRFLEGEDREPWQMFRVHQTQEFNVQSIGRKSKVVQIESRSLADYLAACLETYPSLRNEALRQYDLEIVPNGAWLLPEFVEAFHERLKKRIRLPSNINSTLEALGNVNAEGVLAVPESYDICYHRPSQMFNITQMHRTATLSQLNSGLNDTRIRCDNFVEVRGQPNLEGNFVPLPMLPMFAEAFRYTIGHQPEPRHGNSMHDPSDFSRMSSRIILAHQGLVAFASMSQTQDQVSHCPKDEEDFQRSEKFLHTYFGDMKVFPKASDGMHEYPRPAHWAKYKTAEELQAGVEASKHNSLKSIPVSPESPGSSYSSGSLPPLSVLMDRDPGAPCHLAQAIRNRANAIAQASIPFERPVEDTNPDSAIAQLQRRANNAAQSKGVTNSFLQKNPNILRKPHGYLDDPTQPFYPVQFDRSVREDNQEVKGMRQRWELTLDKNETWEGGAGLVRHPLWAEASDDGVSLDSSVRRELVFADARLRAEPTEVDDASVDQKMAPDTVLGNANSISDDSRNLVGNLNDLPSFLPQSGVAVGSYDPAFLRYPSAVRAMDNRSFENLPNSTVAHVPQGLFRRDEKPSSAHSFFEGQTRMRPNGMSRGEHRRQTLTATERAWAERFPGRQLPTVEEESLPNTHVPEDWEGDSKMTDVDEE